MDVALAQTELLDQLSRLGWTLNKVDMKQGAYAAKGTGPGGEKIERTGSTPEMALAALIHFAVRANGVRQYAARRTVSAWSTNWMPQAEDISQAYAQMPAFDEKAVPAWKALASESKIQADAIRRQIKIEETDEPEPYTTAKEMCEDVHKNKHLSVSRADSEHPIWSQADVVDFRIVHDVLGFCQSGGTFSWAGENLATAAHMPLLSPLAREALFVESIGQSAYTKHSKGYAKQKVGLLNEYLHPVQEHEGEHVYVPHGGIPQLEDKAGQMDGDQVDPAQYDPNMVQQRSEQTPGVFSSTDDQPSIDPNQGWEPPINPEEMQPAINSQPGDDSRDYIGKMATVLNAQKIDTEWWDKEPHVQDQAIMNAFRVALLSPRKHLKWNAAHYQALMHTHPKASARDMWHTLEKERERYNQSKGYKPESHLNYLEQRDYLAEMLLSQHPEMDEHEAHIKAKEIIYDKIKEFESEIGEQDDDDNKKVGELKRYNMARKMTEDWIKENFTPVKARGKGKWIPGQKTMFGAHEPTEEPMQLPGDDWTPSEVPTKDMSGASREGSKYGAFMTSQIEPIAEVGQHIEEIRRMALRDIEETGGQGHMFRNFVVHLGVPGLGPKVVSFVWLMLRPMSSELGVIDTHALRGLRIPESKMTRRDFYKAERMQHAAKDASGYQHMPLGLYHWGMWDMVRTPGEHSDHSTMRVLDPVPWESPKVKWDNAMNSRAGVYTGPSEFEATRPLQERVAQDFEEEFEGQPRNQVPKRTATIRVAEKSLKDKRQDLKYKLDDLNENLDEDAKRFGFYAAVQVSVKLKQFEDFLKDQDKHHRPTDANWRRFKKLAIEAFNRWHEGGPSMWVW